ncbi:MAG: hypothetical protein KAI70_01435 [Candidatus Omnitrophica bacterium]|nr:hypothetical protein [Candidatus Omnitrophota bacterium]
MGTALDQFKESLALAVALKKLERDKFPNTPNLKQQPFVKGLRGGAAVLMVAAFEFFLRNLFEENISNLNTIPVSIDFNKLPDRMKVTTVFNGLKRVMNGPLYEEKLPKTGRINDVISAGKLLINEQIDPETFSETGSNPNGNTVKEKFKQVGIEDIFGNIKASFEVKWKNPVAHDFIKSKLDNIVRTRHVVAHTADTLNISRKSQNESFRFVKILAELLEKELQKHIKDIKKNAKK